MRAGALSRCAAGICRTARSQSARMSARWSVRNAPRSAEASFCSRVRSLKGTSGTRARFAPYRQDGDRQRRFAIDSELNLLFANEAAARLMGFETVGELMRATPEERDRF